MQWGQHSAADEVIGNVTATLKATGLYDNTIIVITSDVSNSCCQQLLVSYDSTCRTAAPLSMDYR